MIYFNLHIIDWLEKNQLPCLFKKLTQFDCPGCGMQRSFLLLLRGDLAGSLAIYPALLPVLLLFLLLVLHLVFRIRNGATMLRYAYFFCAGVILLSYIYRIAFIKTPI